MSTGNIPLQNAVPNQLITSALWNAELANIQTLTAPEGIEGYEDTDAETQIQTAPYPGSVLSKATALSGEIERIRYQLAQILGTDYWYKPAATDLTSVGNVIVPVGGVIDYPVVTAPNANWHLADGTAISRAGYPALFTLIGTTFGVGNGTTTFNLPDYRDRMSIGAGTTYSVAATGGAISNTPAITITDPGHNHTQNSHTHTMANHTHTGPSHTHTLSFTNEAGTGGTAPTAANHLVHDGSKVSDQNGGTLGTHPTLDDTTSAGGTGASGTPSTNTSDGTVATNNSNTTGITAASASVPTLPPYLGMYKLIRVI